MLATASSIQPTTAQLHPSRATRTDNKMASPAVFGPSLIEVVTLVLWLSTASVGALGFVLHERAALPLKRELPPVVAEKLHVELSDAPPPPVAPANEPPNAPPPLSALAQPQAPQPLAVTDPSPSIAFALPVVGTVRHTDAAHAAHTRSSVDTGTSSGVVHPPVQALVFGEGEGRQPAPHYPPYAARLGQEGIVTVRLSVAASGEILSADASEPCAWPLLNEAAVQTVRERWHFAAGVPRLYDVAIRFRLKK